MILESSKRTAGIFLIYLYMFSRLRSQPVQSCGFRGDIVIEILPVSAAEQFAYDMTVPEDQNAVRKAGGIGVMCDHKDRGLEFTVRFAQSIQQFRGRSGVESARGLIGKQDIRPFYDGSGCGSSLPLTAGKFGRIFVKLCGDAEPFREPLYCGGDLSGRDFF